MPFDFDAILARVNKNKENTSRKRSENAELYATMASALNDTLDRRLKARHAAFLADCDAGTYTINADDTSRAFLALDPNTHTVLGYREMLCEVMERENISIEDLRARLTDPVNDCSNDIVLRGTTMDREKFAADARYRSFVIHSNVAAYARNPFKFGKADLLVMLLTWAIALGN